MSWRADLVVVAACDCWLVVVIVDVVGPVVLVIGGVYCGCGWR